MLKIPIHKAFFFLQTNCIFWLTNSNIFKPLERYTDLRHLSLHVDHLNLGAFLLTENINIKEYCLPHVESFFCIYHQILSPDDQKSFVDQLPKFLPGIKDLKIGQTNHLCWTNII